jgi:hypothetical protein
MSALSDLPALKPCWGKPAVRNFREGDGNVGIIRSPLCAFALSDQSSAYVGEIWVFSSNLPPQPISNAKAGTQDSDLFFCAGYENWAVVFLASPALSAGFRT